MTSPTEQAIAHDLDACDAALAVLGKGKLRNRYLAHRKACFAAIRSMNEADGLALTDAELLAELEGPQ